jgi:uncharacterized membrane protein
MTNRDEGPQAGSGAPMAESASFHTSMAHLYRAEMHRMTVWRRRLDTTTNWAVLLLTGLTTFALGSERAPAGIMLLGVLFIAMFMFIEARRYQRLHHSNWRLRVIEKNYYVPLLRRPRDPSDRWRQLLASDLANPHFTIGIFDASRLRLRRNYVMLLYVIAAVWLTKLFIHPRVPATASEFLDRLAVEGLVSAETVAAGSAVLLVLVTALAAWAPSEEGMEGWVKEMVDPGEPE